MCFSADYRLPPGKLLGIHAQISDTPGNQFERVQNGFMVERGTDVSASLA